MLIAGESVFISVLGGIAGILISYPVAIVFSEKMSSFLPVFQIGSRTLVLCVLVSLGIGILSAILPMWRASRIQIAEALRHVG